MERSIFKDRLFLTILIISIPLVSICAAQVQKTFTWKYPVNMQTMVKFDNYNCDLTIHSWDKSEAEYHLTIEVTGRTKDDEERLLKFIEGYNFSHSGASVQFSTIFWKNRRTINNKTTLEIEGQKSIELSEFNMKGELWIPAQCTFSIDSKYSRIDMEDFSGKLKMELYNDHLRGGNITSAAELEAKYATIELRDLGGFNAELYNCDFDAANAGDLLISSKYSKVNLKNAGRVSVDSYNDKIAFEKTGALKFSAKYSDLKSNTSASVNLDCYNGTVEITNSDDIKLTSKYAEYSFEKTGDLKVVDTYNDKFHIGKLATMRVDVSKYSVYRLDEVANAFIITDGYNDNVDITRTTASLSGISVNGKYMDISLGILQSLNLRLKANIKYPSLDMNESAFTTKTKILDDSELQYDGTRGADKPDLPLVEIKGYEVKLRIRDLK